jgi:hypothetical protein
MDNFRYTPLVAARLPDLGDLSAKEIYVAGNAAQVEATRAQLAGNGVPAGRLIEWVPR